MGSLFVRIIVVLLLKQTSHAFWHLALIRHAQKRECSSFLIFGVSGITLKWVLADITDGV